MTMVFQRCNVFLWILLPLICHASFDITLGAQDEKVCFAIHTPQNEKAVISGDYDVIQEEDETPNVKVWLEDGSRRQAWRSRDGHFEDQFAVTVPSNTKYLLCFEPESNKLDASVEVDVGFSIRVHPLPRTLNDGEIGPDAKRALDLVESSLEIEDDWESMLDHFDYLRRRESVHNVISAEIMSRVLRWSLIEAALVVGMATAQVMYWKKFFEQRRYL